MLQCAPYYYADQKPGRCAPRTSKDFQCLTIDVFGALPESGGNTGSTILKVEESQRRSNNDLAAKYEGHYQQTQLRWSLPSSWMGTPRQAMPMVRDIVRHGPVAPSVVLMHPSYCLQCIAPFPTPHLTVLYLRTNLSAPISNAQLPTQPPRIIGKRNCGSYNHCMTSTRLLQLTMMMMKHTFKREYKIETLRRELTDRKVRTSAPRLLLSRLEQPSNILALMFSSGNMAATHRKA
ncbi:hypothetical protein T265_06809 [Opisthorchis viverrini]|uniref:Uncharacterized protein n=1 Tax=Opisthorchis viverrini TaxID=6198 RepID=A0A074ZF12_OPIVI|nr:hypothetical protein T265_06809 [Opisthorchis viverrini]KER25773.1 hypothetical protein T265_06809 [Opisthorchis viverrini]